MGQLLTPLAVRVGALPWLPRFLPQIVWTDRLLQRSTGSRLSLLDVAGLPNLNLTVVGRRSGLPRTTPLLCAPHDGGWLIAGSYFGGPDMPTWVGNLRAAGEGEVEVDGERRAVAAREADPAERARLWPVLVAVWPNFARYERRTERTIPVFVLTPRS
jgi:deazaflavin-dependent oxidoreductase (nitroreductase family)